MKSIQSKANVHENLKLAQTLKSGEEPTFKPSSTMKSAHKKLYKYPVTPMEPSVKPVRLVPHSAALARLKSRDHQARRGLSMVLQDHQHNLVGLEKDYSTLDRSLCMPEGLSIKEQLRHLGRECIKANTRRSLNLSLVDQTYEEL